MISKINIKVREIINKWLKKQATYRGTGAGMSGYLIRNSQAQKLKRDLWKNIEFIENGMDKK